jgi:hypothetical protein
MRTKMELELVCPSIGIIAYCESIHLQALLFIKLFYIFERQLLDISEIDNFQKIRALFGHFPYHLSSVPIGVIIANAQLVCFEIESYFVVCFK